MFAGTSLIRRQFSPNAALDSSGSDSVPIAIVFEAISADTCGLTGRRPDAIIGRRGSGRKTAPKTSEGQHELDLDPIPRHRFLYNGLVRPPAPRGGNRGRAARDGEEAP